MKKAEVAAVLGIGERSVNLLVQKGQLSVQKVKGKTSDVAVFDDAEVYALKAERESGIVKVEKVEPFKVEAQNFETAKIEIPKVATKSLAKVEVQPSQSELAGFAHFAEMLRMTLLPQEPTLSDLAAKPVLKISEAAKLTGLSEDSIRKAGKVGDLKVVREGRADRISRVNLDKWISGKFD